MRWEKGMAMATFTRQMQKKSALPGSVNSYMYTATIATDRPADHFTPRIVAAHSQVNIPAEEAHIKWYC